MNRYFHIFSIFSIFAAGFLLVSCKGRTVENMIPDGDTIEVVINQDAIPETPAPLPAEITDSISV